MGGGLLGAVAAPDVIAPTITSSNAINLAENSALSHTLTANEPVTWTKTGGADTALFTLVGSTLSMTAKDFDAPIDVGANNTYIVQVTATDAALNATNQTITVTVTDVDEVAPTITSSNAINLAENSALSHTLTANEAVTWTKTGGADTALFTLVGSTLSMTAKDFDAPIDSGANNTYIVQVTATDAALNATNQTITVTVTDIDEVAPTITSSNAINLAEDVALSHTLTANEAVTWTKTGGADTALFTLVGSTLSMTAKDFEAPIDSDANNTYIVQVTATDAALNATNQTITVTVTDVVAIAPIIANQSIDFGRKTLVSAGDMTLVNTGGEITSITLGTRTVGSAHWNTTAYPIIPTSVPADVQYVWTGCTATGPGGTSATFTLTINTIALGWSVSNVAELEAAGEHASLTYGDSILLREGPINPLAEIKSIRRTVAIAGTFTPPSLIDAGDPDKGSDLTTANYVQIKPHPGKTATIVYINMLGDLVADGGFLFTGLNFTRTIAPGTPIASPDTEPMLRFDDIGNCAVTDCVFQSTISSETVSDVYSSIMLTGITPDIKLKENEFYDTWNALVCSLGRHDGLEFIGNLGRRQYNDVCKFFGGDDIYINFNQFYDKKQPGPDALAHVDYFQFSMTAVDFSPDNIRIIGNRLWRADGSAPQAATSNPATEGLDGQGGFIDDLTSSFTITNLVIAGNTITNCVQRGISVTRATAPIIICNTVVHDRNQETTNQQDVGIFLKSCTGGTARFNIANATPAEETPVSAATISDNVVASRTATSPTSSAYEELFDDPQFGSIVTDPSVNFNILVGGLADVASPKAGASPYVNYAARTTSFPSLAGTAVAAQFLLMEAA